MKRLFGGAADLQAVNDILTPKSLKAHVNHVPEMERDADSLFATVRMIKVDDHQFRLSVAVEIQAGNLCVAEVRNTTERDDEFAATRNSPKNFESFGIDVHMWDSCPAYPAMAGQRQ